MTFPAPIIPTFYPSRQRRWRRIHTSFVIATLINFMLLLTVGVLAGRAVEDPIYEVNLAERIRNDAAEVQAPKPKKKMVLAPAPAVKSHLTLDPRKVGGGVPAPAPAPGNRPDHPLAKAPPPLKINAPRVNDDTDPVAENNPSVVTGRPLPADASDRGNPEGVSGGTGPQDSEGPGGTGTGGSGTGGKGTGGNGQGGRFGQLVNRVVCLGCHQNAVQGCDQPPRPYEIEKLFTAVRWKFGGSEHPLTIGCTINDQGYISNAVVVQSSGNAEVDASAIELLQMSKWYPGRRGGGAVEVYVEVPLKVYF